MRHILSFSAFLCIMTIVSCKKDNTDTNCFSSSATVRQITNERAIIKAVNGEFLIVEKGTIDTQLNPCALPQEFQIDNLQITISGEVKATPQEAVCCIENFVITEITR